MLLSPLTGLVITQSSQLNVSTTQASQRAIFHSGGDLSHQSDFTRWTKSKKFHLTQHQFEATERAGTRPSNRNKTGFLTLSVLKLDRVRLNIHYN